MSFYFFFFFFFKQKTAYEMRISDWNSDVCSSDLCHFNLYPGPSGRMNGQFRSLEGPDSGCPICDLASRHVVVAVLIRYLSEASALARSSHRIKSMFLNGKMVSPAGFAQATYLLKSSCYNS